jgi:hypothetical protein
MPVEPIFLDKSGRRWQVVKTLLFISATILVALPLFLVLSITKVDTSAKTYLLAQQDEQLTTGSTGRAFYRDAPVIRSWQTRFQAHARVD